MNKNFLCKCGHEEEAHVWSGITKVPSFNNWSWCTICYGKSLPNHRHEFKADNLKYLETLYESRTGRA